jgi:peroxiredoxin/uncharacterized membrane protein YphA (DoxX/SURF4 family)
MLLAAVFLLAGIAKLRDLPGFRTTLRDFGVPGKLADILGLPLPIAEICVGAALLFLAAAWWGAVGALAFLLSFCIAISLNLARGRRPDCRCFGQLHSAPIGSGILIRNGLLAAAAGLFVWQGRSNPGSGILAVLPRLTLAQTGALLVGGMVVGALAVEGWLVFHLARQNGRLLDRLDSLETRLDALETTPQPVGSEFPAVLASPRNTPAPNPTANPPASGKTSSRRPCCGGGRKPVSVSVPMQALPIGTTAPAFRLPNLTGDLVTLDALCTLGSPVLLLFSSPHCDECETLLPDLAQWQQEYQDRLTLVVISQGTPEENRARHAGCALENILLQRDFEIADAYHVHATPGALLIAPEGAIESSPALGAETIRAFVTWLADHEGLMELRSAFAVTAEHSANNHTLSPAMKARE